MAILIILLVIALFYIIYSNKKQLKQNNRKLKEENEKLLKSNLDLSSQVRIKREEKDFLEKSIQRIISEKENLTSQLVQIQSSINEARTNAEQEARKHMCAYFEVLESNYLLKEKEFDDNVNHLNKTFLQEKERLDEIFKQEKAELDKIKATRAAAIEANLREEEIKNKRSFYCLQLSPRTINDIDILEKTKLQLTNPRVLSMLIWSTYFQKDMTALCNRILGTDTVTGIYKITNQENGKCYIGQSVDVSKRWKDHAKCGLGIDAPLGNQLYNDMQTYGIWKFSWELLEQCPREQLNEKERYYINLYQSQDFGYNSTKGNK